MWGAAAYEDAVRAVLLAHKERGALGLAGALGRALAGSVRAAVARSAGAGTLLLVPVPSARGAVRARGHDAGRRIAWSASAELRRTGTPARVVAALRQRRGWRIRRGWTPVSGWRIWRVHWKCLPGAYGCWKGAGWCWWTI